MKQRPGVLAGGLAVLAVHAALLWLYHFPGTKELLGDEGTYARVAARLAAGEAPELPLLWPPLYPHFVSWIFRATGGSLLAVQLVQTALLVAVAWLGRDLVRRLSGEGPAAEAVFWGTLGFPPLVAFAHYLRPEVLHLALFALALWILAARRDRPAWLAAFGIALGLAQLTKSLLAPFLPVLFLPLFLEGSARDRLLRPSIALAGLLAALAPAALAGDGLRAGNSAWFNLWVGLNDTSHRNLRQSVVPREYRRFEESGPDFETRNAILREKTGDLVRSRGVLRIARDQLGRQYFRLFDKDSYLTDQLPGGVIAARGGGYRDPPAALAWFLRVGSFGLYALVLAGAALGIALCPPRGRRWMWIALLFLAYNVAIFFLLHVKSRFRVPLLPFLFFYTGCAVAALWAGDASRKPWAIPAGSVGALGLLILAFGGAYLD